ncbi:HEAT repeat domain-containing protein [Amycolatopsis sp. lyj-109]|uniref:HEAT repeat domain-containing protein n=1 Tax=Amycolatopsis sp. lyj-109 TaxID=2789287 RepID=UPI00397CFDFB
MTTRGTWRAALHELTGPDWDDAFVRLSGTLVPASGRWNPEAADALPELLDYVANQGAAERPEVLELVYRLAHAARETADERWSAARADAVPRLLTLLDDPVGGVRLIAALVLGEHPDPALLRALLDRWPGEKSEQVRVGLVAAIGELGGEDVLPWLAERTESDAIAAAALTAIARTTGDGPMDRLADLMCGDMSAFAGLPAYGPSPAVHWVAGQLSPRSRAAVLVALATRPRRREAALSVAAAEVADRPSAAEALRPVFGALLDSPERGTAAAVLGCLAPASAEYADRLFALAGDKTLAGDDEVRDYALWALLRLKDRRCVAPLRDRFGSRRNLLSTVGGGRFEGSWSTHKAPGAHEMLMDAPEFAPDFLPWVCRTLDRSTHRFTVWPLTELLQAWGPAGAPAARHVAAQLDAADPLTVEWCADTLAEIGADDELSTVALKKAAKHRRLPWAARCAAATALARLGGDSSLAVKLLRPGLEKGDVQAVAWAASLGTLGAPLEGVLRAFQAKGPRDQVAVAYATARVTGDVGMALPVLLRALTDVDPVHIGWPAIDAMRALAKLGPLPAEVAPVLRELLARDARFSSSGGCDLYRNDETFRRDAARALAHCAG